MKTALGVLWKVVGGRKMLLAIAALAMSALRSRYPDAPLPSDDFVFDLVVAFYAAHSATDIASILKSAAAEYAAGRAGNVRAPADVPR